MAVSEFTTPLDLEAIRADFPILQRPVHGKRLVFLDSASTSQKPPPGPPGMGQGRSGSIRPGRCPRPVTAIRAMSFA